MLHPWSHILYSSLLISHPVFRTYYHLPYVLYIIFSLSFSSQRQSTFIADSHADGSIHTHMRTRIHIRTSRTCMHVNVVWVLSPAIVARHHTERPNVLLCHQYLLPCILAYVAGRGSPGGTSQIQIWIWNAREIATHPPKCIVEATSSLSFAVGATCGFTAFLVW
jgi:hypothetical protein